MRATVVFLFMFVLVLVIFDSGAESFPEGVVLAVLVVGAFIFVIFVFVIFVGVFIFLVIYVIFVGVFRGGGPPVVRRGGPAFVVSIFDFFCL